MGKKVARTVHVIGKDGLRVAVFPGEELPPLGTRTNAEGETVPFEVTNEKVFTEPEDPFESAVQVEADESDAKPPRRRGGSVSKTTAAKKTTAKKTSAKSSRTRGATTRSTSAKKTEGE